MTHVVNPVFGSGGHDAGAAISDDRIVHEARLRHQFHEQQAVQHAALEQDSGHGSGKSIGLVG